MKMSSKNEGIFSLIFIFLIFWLIVMTLFCLKIDIKVIPIIIIGPLY